MKKVIIGTTALFLSVALVGCGNSAGSAAINSLSSQLDDTSNTISSIQTVNPNDLNMTKESLDSIATRDNSSAIYDNVIIAQQTLLGEEYYKMDILSKTSALKNKLSKDLKLSKAQTQAVKELTNNLDKYTNSIEYTKYEMSSTVKSISSLKKNADKNADRINAKLNRLACNSNTRSAYYENILKTLSQIEEYVGQTDTENPQDNNQSQTNNVQQNNQTSTQQNINQQNSTNQKTQIKNIDTYLPNQNTNQNSENQNEECTNNENCPNCNNCNENITNPYADYNSNNFNRMYGGAYGYGAGMYGSNGVYGPYGYGANNAYGLPNGAYGAGYYGNPYGNGFGYRGFNANNINFSRFNPTRNTDTYAPMQRNIDTYRLPTNENGVFGNEIINNPTTFVAAEPEDDSQQETENLQQNESLKNENLESENLETKNREAENLQMQETYKAEKVTSGNVETRTFSTKDPQQMLHHSKKLEELNLPEKNIHKPENKLLATFLQMTEEEELNQPIIGH